MIPTSGEKKPNQQVGRYAIFDEIASGGMATVHLARFAGPLGFARVVAAKRLHRHLIDNEEFKRMFVDEARLAARIRHPNVVPTLDVLVKDREIIIVMEYVHGESLLALYRTARERKASIPLPIAAAILVSILHGLHAAHEARSETGEPLRIVHRDVSPHNVLVGLDGAVRVLDFGVAKAIQAQPDKRPGTLKGKFSYMAPELLHGGQVTRQADIFAAAVVFWELVTGRKLFGGMNEHERMYKILSGNYPAPSTVVADLPGVVDRIVMKALHQDVGSRYATALEMAVEVETHLAPASQRVVGEWVAGLVGSVLEQRAELLQQIEVSHIHSIAPIGATDVDEPRALRLPNGDDGEALRAFGSPKEESVPGTRRWIIAGFVTGLVTAVAATVLLRMKPSTNDANASAWPQQAPSALPAPNPAAKSFTPDPPSPMPTAASADSQDAVAIAKPAQSSRARPGRPPPSPRHGSTRPGNSSTFLPDDL